MTRSRLYGIAYGCPKMNRNKDCLFLEIDNLSFKEKVDWINELDEEKIEVILKHHELCTQKITADD